MKITPQTQLHSYLNKTYAEDRINLRETTLAQIRTSIRAFERFLERAAMIADLQEDTVTSFLAWYSQFVVGRTVNAKRKDLLALWRLAWDKHHTRIGPRHIARARESQPEPEAYDLATMKAILDQASKIPGTIGRPAKDPWVIPRADWWTALMASQYSTAARIGALRSTLTVDCDLRAGTLLLRAKEQKQNRDQSFTLMPEAVEAIRAIYDPNRKYLFWWPYCKRYFYTCYDRFIIKPLGIVPKRKSMEKTHKIRRTTLSHVASKDREAAYQLAGHRDRRTTDQHYLDPRIVNPQGAAPLIPSLKNLPPTPPDDDPDDGMILHFPSNRAG